MGTAIFSDVHADAEALAAFRSFIRKPFFQKRFGTVDLIVNLGDLLHRGNHPVGTLEQVRDLSREYRLVSVMGNHDNAFLTGLSVSGSDPASLYRHEQLRGSPLLSIFDGMPVEWVEDGMLFVHGGPMDLGPDEVIRQKFWQRIGSEAGDSWTGYHYTPGMAFSVLNERGLKFLCCGHQHTSACYRDHERGIQECFLDYQPEEQDTDSGPVKFEVARVPLDRMAILRVGACFGRDAEFAYTDFRTFYFIRLACP